MGWDVEERDANWARLLTCVSKPKNTRHQDKLTEVEDDKTDKFLGRHIGRCRQCIRHMLVTRENG